ncbi:MAG: hypothetical protein BM555_04830 [Crocinitomix sp. MedPE-SWsnd]|nr:MAG: hypothetical protein BM555_04830 [Crocinitomix sp. MedPE-SWsnd]
MRTVIPTLILSGLLFSCGGDNPADDGELTSEEVNSIINSPLEGDFQNDAEFKFDPTKPATFETPNGSSIEIPANAIVDENGDPVKKKVDLTFTQYHSAADLMASGIPMEYDSAGTSNHFESAGMFSLDARVKKKKVFLKEGESIKVNLASDKNDQMNFYELDEKTGDWTYDPAPVTPIANPSFDRSKYPIKPVKRNKNAFVLDLDFDLSDFDELEAFSGIVWEYSGDHDSLDPRKNPVVSSTEWTDFDLEPTYDEAFEYWLVMNRNRKLTYKTKVKAALQGEDFENAMAQYKDKKIEIAAKRDSLKKPFIRSVEIGGFGTFNCDYIHSMMDPEEMIADFDFGSEDLKARSAVFVMYPETEVVVNYYQPPYTMFALDKAQPYEILAILPGNKVAAYKGDATKSYGKSEFTFKMDIVAEGVQTKADFERTIAGL